LKIAGAEKIMKYHESLRLRCLQRQQGFVLLIALIALAAMSMAGVALMRTVDSSNMIAGNIAFRNAMVQMSDVALLQAEDWLKTNGATDSNLNSDISSMGYYATMQDGITDFSAANWEENAFHMNGGSPDEYGNRYSYMIHRMCTNTGDMAFASCYQESSQATGNSSAAPAYKPGEIGSSAMAVFYRITLRAIGPKNTVAYTQMIVIKRASTS
jgi:type IV pilus assembly protein PilX